MAKVLLLCLADEDASDHSYQRGAYTRLKQSADMGKAHHILVQDPREANIILFAELYLTFAFNVRRHPYYKSYRNKCFAFSIADNVIPFVPGVYASIEKSWYSPRRVRSGFYLSILENPHAHFESAPVARDLLYSFVGSVNTAPARERLAKLQHPRSVFIDTSKESLATQSTGTDAQRDIFWKTYADIARRSQFVLCPRGRGTSSVRLFETMKMGRAPVILSDQWVPPEGPQWEQFALRIPEKDAANVPKILEEREAEAAAMGVKARQEWERWFAPDAVFDTVVDWCLRIKNARRLPEDLARLTVYPQLLRKTFFRRYLKSYLMGFKPENAL